MHEAEGSRTDRPTSKFSSKTVNFFLRYNLCLGHAKHGDKGGVRLRQRDLQCVGIQSFQPLNTLCCTGTEFFCALHTLKEPGPWRVYSPVQETGEGIDKILRDHLSTVMKFHSLMQMKGP